MPKYRFHCPETPVYATVVGAPLLRTLLKVLHVKALPHNVLESL